jgi:hypothetical protein
MLPLDQFRNFIQPKKHSGTEVAFVDIRFSSLPYINTPGRQSRYQLLTSDTTLGTFYLSNARLVTRDQLCVHLAGRHDLFTLLSLANDKRDHVHRILCTLQLLHRE